MEFERIGKNTIQCHMTVEEMNEYGLRIEDFFTNQEKSRDFLEQLVERAEEEIGYEVEGGMISMQLMRMPDDSLIITFSDHGEDGLHSMLNQIQNLAGMMEGNAAGAFSDAMEKEAGASEESIHYEENMKNFEESLKKSTAKQGDAQQKSKRKKSQNISHIYQFEKLSAIENFAETIELSKNIPSKLYKDVKTGKWYLLLKKGKLKMEEYQNICHRLQEYGMLLEGQPFKEQYCKEHYEAVITKHALQTIKEYLN